MRVWRWCLDAHRGTSQLKTTNTFSASEELEKRILPAWSLTPGGLAEAASRFKVPTVREAGAAHRAAGIHVSGRRSQPIRWTETAAIPVVKDTSPQHPLFTDFSPRRSGRAETDRASERESGRKTN